jgi:hypothetical protein
MHFEVAAALRSARQSEARQEQQLSPQLNLSGNASVRQRHKNKQQHLAPCVVQPQEPGHKHTTKKRNNGGLLLRRITTCIAAWHCIATHGPAKEEETQ